MMTYQALENCMAPAKLNLFIHVIGRRADGFHLLESVFCLISRYDVVHFYLRADKQVRRVNAIEGVSEDSDLVVRAARLLQPYAHVASCGVDIVLEKNLPMGGGLGGGSSDAATTLIALNRLWKANLSRAQLMHLGLRLGADVPFFLCGYNAFVEGVGDRITPITVKPAWYIVLEPGVNVSTAEIFCAENLTRNSKSVKMSRFSESLEIFGKNDLQAVAEKRHSEIKDALDWLGQYGRSRMSGSGSCVFCTFDDESAADKVLIQGREDWRIWKAKGLAQHPMNLMLD